MGSAGTVSGQQVLVDIVRRIDPASAANRLVSRFRSEIPAYRHLPEIVLETAVTEMVRQNIEAFTRSVVEGRAVEEADIAPFGRSAAERAAEGFPLEDLVHAYRLGGRMLWQEAQDATAPDERDALPKLAELLMSYIDAVSALVTRSYLGGQDDTFSEGERRVRDVLAALTSTEPLLPVDHELADRLGYAVRDSYRPLLAVIPKGARLAHARLAARLRAAGVMALTETDRVLGLLGEGDTAPQEAGVVVYAGPPVARTELAEALDDLRLLADLSALNGHTRPLGLDDYLPELLLARSPNLAAAVRRRVLGPLEAYELRRETDLLGTLEALLACGLDRRKAAATLHVHRNTLDYRVRRAEELSGIELSRPDDLVLLSLALRQRALDAARAK